MHSALIVQGEKAVQYETVIQGDTQYITIGHRDHFMTCQKYNTKAVHSSHTYPVKIGCVLLYSPYLFCKKLFSMQDKLVINKQQD